MASKYDDAVELAEEIKELNVGNDDRIPSSDTFIRNASSSLSRDRKQVQELLHALRDAHWIFIIQIVQGDERRKEEGVEAYVTADKEILEELRNYAYSHLEKAYESTYYKRQSATQIIRELFPEAKRLNNTPVGRYLNLAVMIEEYIRIMNSSEQEYAEEARKSALYRIFNEEDKSKSGSENLSLDDMSSPEEIDPTAPRPIEEYEPVFTGNWGKMVTKFPVQFLLKIHFRKYQFDIVRRLIVTGRIYREEDLKFIRDTIELMESRTQQDRILTQFVDEMVELRRLAQRRLNGIQKKKAAEVSKWDLDSQGL